VNAGWTGRDPNGPAAARVGIGLTLALLPVGYPWHRSVRALIATPRDKIVSPDCARANLDFTMRAWTADQ
jgi:hypothetical protein